MTQKERVLEEIIVTARKRVESMQDVSVAVTAFSGTQIDNLMARAPVTCPPDTEVRAAATLMRDKRISSLCVTEGDDLVGVPGRHDDRFAVGVVDDAVGVCPIPFDHLGEQARFKTH